VIHLYGVVDELEGLPPVAGVDAGRLERRRIEGLELVVSRSALEARDVTQEAVLSHAHVVEELLARSGAVLPARFGSAFSDEQELADAVRTKAPALARGLNLVRGCVEFGLRVLGRDGGAESAPAGLSGSDYMRTRLAEEKSRRRLAEELHEPLARLSRESTRFGGASSDLLQSAYLVPRQDVSAFGEHVRRLEVAHPDLTIVCTGPWPPYTFAANGEGGDA
jgi:Gas vesicle synthesis protein GvpL/GvpF